jgi:hypothetical protein
MLKSADKNIRYILNLNPMWNFITEIRTFLSRDIVGKLVLEH